MMIKILLLITIGFALFVAAFMGTIIFGNSNTTNNSSILIKDNSLRYEKIDRNGKKNKRSFSLTQLDKYLRKHKEIDIIDNLILYKKDIDKASNANNLHLKDENGKTYSLKELANQDINKYNEVCGFLEKISDKDDLELDFRLKRYVSEYNNLILINQNIKNLKQLYNKETDIEIKEKTKETINKLDECKEKMNIIQKDEQLRKLNDYYIKMLIEIIENYEILNKQDNNSIQTTQSKEKIISIFNLINPVFDSLYLKEENVFDNLEAQVNSLQDLANQSNQLLKEIKQK